MKAWLIVVIVVLVLAVLAIAARLLFGRRKRSTRFVLIGATDAGKTAMFYKLATQKTVDTTTSQTANETEFRVPGAKLPAVLVDQPGSDRLREAVRTSLAKGVRGVVFVLDAANKDARPKDAELLYEVLTHTPTRVPLLICCNKSDLATSASMPSLRQSLEHELTRMQEARASMSDLKDKTAPTLTGSTHFTFAALSTRPIHFERTNTKTVDGVRAVRDFVQTQMGHA